MSRRLDTFTVCQPGLESITAEELRRLGVAGRPVHGGVVGSMTWSQLGIAHLQVRTATRVLVRVARFDADTFGALAAGLRRVDWGAWWPAGAGLDVRASAAASKLIHTGAIEARVREVVPDGDGDPQSLFVRVDHDLVTVSLDATGVPLYQRGWRTEAVAAPLRETLAAALVLWSGWDGRRPLVDPCAGSGTIAVEAAMLARRIPPGRGRSFSWQQWPGAGAVGWETQRAAADADVREAGPVVVAADVDTEAVAVAARNAKRAGVAIDTVVAAAAELTMPSRPGWVVTNPPYGRRLPVDRRDLYAEIGRLATPPWRLAVVAAQGSPTSAFGRGWAESLALRSGGLPVRFLRD